MADLSSLVCWIGSRAVESQNKPDNGQRTELGLHDVQIKCARPYLFFSKSAIRQSTTYCWGDRIYTASMSRFVGRRCSICSTSVCSLVSGWTLEATAKATLTCDIQIKDIIFAHRIEDQFPTRLIHDHDFPLQTSIAVSSPRG